MKLYPNTKSNQNIVNLEKEIISYWENNNIFEQSVNNPPINKNYHKELQQIKPNFIFYDGPPFANGFPHYGHLLTGFLKDLYARFNTSLGKKVERVFGWDCHGLPAEMKSEKELKTSGRKAIKEYGIDKFNAHCKNSVLQYVDEWKYYITRQGRWVDFENSYKTMDKNFMESVIWVFKELYKKNLIYHGVKVMPYSVACQTPLSNFETRMDDCYRMRADKAITISFELLDKLSLNITKLAYTKKQFKLLSWTTTPWTLPSNLALAVNTKITYVILEAENCYYILAKSRVDCYKKEFSQYKIIGEFLGKELIGKKYKPLFNYFANHKNSFVVLPGTFVTEDSGTGIVHLAPAFGEDDYVLCKENNIQIVCPIDDSGYFTNEVKDLQSIHIFESTSIITQKLKLQNNWIKTELYNHNYPHCWRTDTPLIYKAIPSWYVKVSDLKQKLINANQKINWIPDHIKNGLFGQWLENVKDWSISRYRFWGTPIPVWMSDNPNYPRIDVYGSVAEIEKDFGVKVEDLHRPFIDSLTRKNPDDPSGESMMKRVEDVFDCWFESGCMPYGKEHYPFENQEKFHENFPADFITEYKAQTRGWFYTLIVISVALFDKPPFLNCICHGVILDQNGSKLSKRLNNYQDPKDIMELYGADALRFTLLSSTVSSGGDFLLDKNAEIVKDCFRNNINAIWQAYHFFCMYANADKIKAEINYRSNNIFDRFIINQLAHHILQIEQSLINFNTQEAYKTLASFFEILNNWYIRRNRERFWKSNLDQCKIDAYNTLFTCLLNMCIASSSMIPMLTESIYQGLSGNDNKKSSSVHLQPFPRLENIKIDTTLLEKMNIIRLICTSGLNLRNRFNIKVRQPLSKIILITNCNQLDPEYINIIKDELNVKQVDISNNFNLPNLLEYKLLINIPELVKRIPEKIQQLKKNSEKGSWKLLDNGKISVENEILNANEYKLELKSLKEDIIVINSIDCAIKIDTKLDDKLIEEGLANDIIRQVQECRKEAKFDISDSILLEITAVNNKYSNKICNVLNNQKLLIEHNTLSKIVENIKNNEFEKEVDINEMKIKIIIKRN